MVRCHHTTEATGTAPTEMGQSIQLVLIVSLLSLFPGSQGQGEECCAVKVVENSPDSSLDGTYTLSDNGAKREEICIDGCVYERDGLEYCFISKPVAESADVQCDDGFTGSTEFPGTGSTGTGSTMSPVSMDTTGSTFHGSMPTGSTFDGSMPTESTFDGSLPTGSTMDGSMPTESTFDGSMPTVSTLDGSMPTGSTFDGSMPTGSTIDGSLPTGSTFDGSMPTGSTMDGSMPTGLTFDGSMPTGSTFDGSAPTG